MKINGEDETIWDTLAVADSGEGSLDQNWGPKDGKTFFF